MKKKSRVWSDEEKNKYYNQINAIEGRDSSDKLCKECRGYLEHKKGCSNYKTFGERQAENREKLRTLLSRYEKIRHYETAWKNGKWQTYKTHSYVKRIV